MDEHVKWLSKYGTDYTLVEAENVTLREKVAELEAQLAEANERLAKAEAERVEAYVPKSFCRDQCAHWKPELEGCGEWKKEHCEVRFFHDYLRNHNMIREA